jgi:hypothetical protein
MTTTTRRRDSRGRYLRTYTLRWTRARHGGEEVQVERVGRTAREIERIGALLIRQPEEQVYNIAVLARGGEDVTFDFACFQG